MKKRMMESVVVLALVVCLIVTNSNIAFAASAKQQTVIDPRIEHLVERADQVEMTEEGVICTFYDSNTTILILSKTDGELQLIIDEGEQHNIITIDAEDNLYLNGKKIEIGDHYVDELARDLERNVTGWSYKTTPGYGSPSDYSVYHRSYSERDIGLNQTLASISVGVLAQVIAARYNLPYSNCISIASQILRAFGSSYTQYLSYKTIVTFHKDSAGGWKDGNYCEKHTTTWYENRDFTGATTTTVEYHCRHLV